MHVGSIENALNLLPGEFQYSINIKKEIFYVLDVLLIIGSGVYC